MKKLLIWILAVVAIVVAVDLVAGYAMKSYILTHELKGDYRSTDHLISKGDSIEELVILGSSVALNSINTKALADSLGITAFNGGSNGQFFPFYLTMLEIIAERPGLKTVILGIKESSLTDTGLGGRYNFLMPYYDTGYESIDSRIEQRSEFDRMMLNSNLYRYNTIWFRILLYAFVEPGIQGNNGFIARGIPIKYPEKVIAGAISDTVTDQRVSEFEQFVKICSDHGIRLIVCITPRYEERLVSSEGERFLRERAMKNNFELWFDATDTYISQDSTLFYDNGHLNYKGAELYTDMIIKRLKE